MDVDDVQAVLAKSRQLLHDKRTERPRPHLDDKVSAPQNVQSGTVTGRSGHTAVTR